MQPVTFTCLHCNNLMAVGPDLMGQQVRCPTCGQIVQAPAAPAPPSYVLEPAPVQPPGVVPSDDIPEIRVQAPKESPESIFGEDHGEDLFGTPAPKVDLPLEITGPPSANGSSRTGFAPYPPPDSLTVAPPPVEPPITIEADLPPSPFELMPPMPPAETPAFLAEPMAAPAIESPPQPQPMNEHSETPAPLMFTDAPNWNDGLPAVGAGLPASRQPSPERRKQSVTAITFLAPYALISTLAAAWFGYQYFDLRSKHPLESVPDIIGEYDPAKRNPHKQTSERTLRLPSPDQALPDKLKVQLGSTLRIGDLAVTPLRVEEGTFQYTTIFESGATETKPSPGPALILHARLKNVSSNVVFHPTDPFFDRQYIADQHRSKPYTMLEVGERRFYGGAFNYLGFRRDANNPRKRMFATGQENDDQPLQPGEERETRFYTVFSDREGPLLAAVHAFKDTLLWRLQLRRGLMNFKDRDYSVCAVVGVQFTAADVHTSASKSQN